MGLDEAIKRFVSAVVEVQNAEKDLKEMLGKLGVVGKVADDFVLSIYEHAIKNMNVENPEDESRVENEEGKEEVKKAEEQPPVKEQRVKSRTEVSKPKRKQFKNRKRKIDIGKFEWYQDRGKYLYNIDGKSRTGKYLPLYKFRKIKLGFYDGDEYALMGLAGSSRTKIEEGMALAQVRNLIREFEMDEVEPDDVEIYEDFIKGVMYRMRPLARDLFNELLNSYHAWVQRHFSTA